MARPAKREEAPQLDPEAPAYAIVKTKGGLWSLRTYAIQGDRILAYDDSEPDERVTCLGLLLQATRGD